MPVYRVRVWDPVLKRQIERTAEGLDAAKRLLDEFSEAKRRPGRLSAERVKFVDVAARYLVAYKTKRDGTPRPKSSLAKERSCLNIYILPVLALAWARWKLAGSNSPPTCESAQVRISSYSSLDGSARISLSRW